MIDEAEDSEDEREPAGELPTRALSSKEAARFLGTTPHQIAMLAAKGEVKSAKIAGILLVDPFSLRQYKQLYRGKGRPLSPNVAWGALWLLSGIDAPWLAYQQRRRLIMKLQDIGAKDLVWQTRKRATLRVFRVNTASFPAIRPELVLSGKSTDRADIFGMPQNERELEGYASTQTIEELQQAHELYEDTTGNLLVHTTPDGDPPWPHADVLREGGERQLPVAAVAADLAASLDPREARAGLRALEILLRGFRVL